MKGNLVGCYWIGATIGFLVGTLVGFGIMMGDTCSARLPPIKMGWEMLR